MSDLSHDLDFHTSISGFVLGQQIDFVLLILLLRRTRHTSECPIFETRPNQDCIFQARQDPHSINKFFSLFSPSIYFGYFCCLCRFYQFYQFSLNLHRKTTPSPPHPLLSAQSKGYSLKLAGHRNGSQCTSDPLYLPSPASVYSSLFFFSLSVPPRERQESTTASSRDSPAPSFPPHFPCMRERATKKWERTLPV